MPEVRPGRAAGHRGRAARGAGRPAGERGDLTGHARDGAAPEGWGPAELLVLREAQRQRLLPTDLRGLAARVPAGGSPGERLFALLRAAGVAGPAEQQLRQVYAGATRGGTHAPGAGVDQAPERVTARRVGPYVLVRELGRGGMGAVWEAVHEQLGRTVALKLVHHERADAQEAERMTREARALERVRHPGVVEVYDVGVVERTSYVAMRLVRGETLRARIARQGPYSPAEGALLGVALAEALEAAHRAGVVHRDVKPHNVLLEPDGRPVLTDFGLARLQDARSLTATGAIMGTPAYMPPEQVEGVRADARADVYALGATLYEVLTGRPPFQGGSLVVLINAVLNHAPESLRKHTPGVPPALEAVVLRCLEKEPDARFASAAELAAALRAWPAQRAGGEAARGRGLAAAIVVLGVGVALALVSRGASPLDALREGARSNGSAPIASAAAGGEEPAEPSSGAAPPASSGAATAVAGPGEQALDEGEAALQRLDLRAARSRLVAAGAALGGDDQRLCAFEARVALVAGETASAREAARRAAAGADPELRYQAHLLLSHLAGSEAELSSELRAAREVFPARGDAYAWGFVRLAYGSLPSLTQDELALWQWRVLGDAHPSPHCLRVRAWRVQMELMKLPQDALATLDQVLERDPRDGVALRLRAWVRAKEGSAAARAAAREDYLASAAALAERRELTDLLRRRAVELLESAPSGGPEARRLREALDLVQLAFRLDPLQYLAVSELAWICALQGRPGEALRQACVALQFNPCQPRMQGLVLQLLDQWAAPVQLAADARKEVSSRCLDLDGRPLALAAHAALYLAAGQPPGQLVEIAERAAQALHDDPDYGAIADRVSERARAAVAASGAPR